MIFKILHLPRAQVSHQTPHSQACLARKKIIRFSGCIAEALLIPLASSSSQHRRHHCCPSKLRSTPVSPISPSRRNPLPSTPCILLLRFHSHHRRSERRWIWVGAMVVVWVRVVAGRCGFNACGNGLCPAAAHPVSSVSSVTRE